MDKFTAHVFKAFETDTKQSKFCVASIKSSACLKEIPVISERFSTIWCKYIGLVLIAVPIAVPPIFTYSTSLIASFILVISLFITLAYAWKDWPKRIGTASCNCVLPIFIIWSNSFDFKIKALYNSSSSFNKFGISFNIVSLPAVGITSFVDCAILTWSLGWTTV